MEELVGATGCRPIVLRRFSMRNFIEGTMGFNANDYTEGLDDIVLQEENNGDRIYRRLNPSLPPKSKMCEHQLRDNTAECIENCPNRALPDGWNYWITHDKTKEGYSWHVPIPCKEMMDRYDLVRSSGFKDKMPNGVTDPNWLEKASTPFFLDPGTCDAFEKLDLRELSKTMGVDVTGYFYRKLVSTFGSNHQSEYIRNLEKDVLQHSSIVAKRNYDLKNQQGAQDYIKTYVSETNLFPENVTNALEKDRSELETLVKDKQKQRKEAHIQKLLEQKETSKKKSFLRSPIEQE